MLHAQLYFLFVFEARNLIFLLFGVNKVLVLVLILVCMHACMHVCVCACECACVRACAKKVQVTRL